MSFFFHFSPVSTAISVKSVLQPIMWLHSDLGSRSETATLLVKKEVGRRLWQQGGKHRAFAQKACNLQFCPLRESSGDFGFNNFFGSAWNMCFAVCLRAMLYGLSKPGHPSGGLGCVLQGSDPVWLSLNSQSWEEEPSVHMPFVTCRRSAPQPSKGSIWENGPQPDRVHQRELRPHWEKRFVLVISINSLNTLHHRHPGNFPRPTLRK